MASFHSIHSQHLFDLISSRDAICRPRLYYTAAPSLYSYSVPCTLCTVNTTQAYSHGPCIQLYRVACATGWTTCISLLLLMCVWLAAPQAATAATPLQSVAIQTPANHTNLWGELCVIDCKEATRVS